MIKELSIAEGRLREVHDSIEKLKVEFQKFSLEIPPTSQVEDIEELSASIEQAKTDIADTEIQIAAIQDGLKMLDEKKGKLDVLRKNLVVKRDVTLGILKVICADVPPTRHADIQRDPSLQKFTTGQQFEAVVSSTIQTIDASVSLSTDKHANWKEKRDACARFIEDLRKIALQESSIHLKNVGILGWVSGYNLEQMEDIGTHILEHRARKAEIEAILANHDQQLENITDVFYTKVMDVLKNIDDLKKTRIPIPGNEDLNNKQVLDIQNELVLQRPEDMQILRSRIKTFFEKLGSKDQLPASLDRYENLIKRLVKEVVDGKIKNIKFLIPRPGTIKAEYRDLVETLKGSGGETATVAILLYCLVAYYRMRQVRSENGKRRYATSAFIMDNPFGKVNRHDLIDVQVSLANALNIQLIVFSGHNDVHIIDKFNTLQSLRSYPDNTENIVEIDNSDVSNTIKGGSILYHRPQVTVDGSTNQEK